MTEQPDSVQAAVARVMGELPAIGKDGKADPRQGGYPYRGIEQITRAAQTLFAKYGVVIVPNVRTIDVVNITVAGKPWTDTTLIVDYKIHGPNGDSLTATTVGIGRDNSDKGANKAMTQAYKYLLLQMLCVSDSKDDTDGVTHEREPDRPAEQEHPNAERVRVVLDQLTRLPDEAKTAIREWAPGQSFGGRALLDDPVWLEQVESWLDEFGQAVES